MGVPETAPLKTTIHTLNASSVLALGFPRKGSARPREDGRTVPDMSAFLLATAPSFGQHSIP